MTTKRVGDTRTVEHLPDERGLRIRNEQTREAVFVSLSLVRALSSAVIGHTDWSENGISRSDRMVRRSNLAKRRAQAATLIE